MSIPKKIFKGQNHSTVVKVNFLHAFCCSLCYGVVGFWGCPNAQSLQKVLLPAVGLAFQNKLRPFWVQNFCVIIAPTWLVTTCGPVVTPLKFWSSSFDLCGNQYLWWVGFYLPTSSGWTDFWTINTMISFHINFFLIISPSSTSHRRPSTSVLMAPLGVEQRKLTFYFPQVAEVSPNPCWRYSIESGLFGTPVKD